MKSKPTVDSLEGVMPQTKDPGRMAIEKLLNDPLEQLTSERAQAVIALAREYEKPSANEFHDHIRVYQSDMEMLERRLTALEAEVKRLQTLQEFKKRTINPGTVPMRAFGEKLGS